MDTTPRSAPASRNQRAIPLLGRGACVALALATFAAGQTSVRAADSPATSQIYSGPLDLLPVSYDVDASVNFDHASAAIIETIGLTNDSGGVVGGIHLSMPAAVTDRLSLERVDVDGTAAATRSTIPGDVEVFFPEPLAVGASSKVVVRFDEVASSDVSSSLDIRFSKSDGILRLGHWLALGSNQHPIRKPGDAQVSAAGHFRLTLHLSDPNLVVAAPGTVVNNTGGTHVYDIDHARDLALAIAPDFHVTRGSVDGIHVEVYTRSGIGGDDTLRFAEAALTTFDDAYGHYPWTRFVLVQSPRNRSGNEYPGIVFLGRTSLEDQVVVAHETAHQWFYAVVGNDQVRDPWIDEALAEYSADYDFGSIARSCSTLHVDLPITAFPDRRPNDQACNEYSQTIYIKGAAMVDGVRRLLGDERFNAAMRALVANHRFEIVTTTDVVATWLEVAPDPAALAADLQPYFETDVARVAAMLRTSGPERLV
jgi:hypothetical protein